VCNGWWLCWKYQNKEQENDASARWLNITVVVVWSDKNIARDVATFGFGGYLH
jgi:hypothetical protein